MADAPLAVPLFVERRASRGSPQPVTLGVPLPRGAVTDPSSLILLDPHEQPVLLQTQTLARWPDGSIKWVLLDFVLHPESPDGRWTVRRHGEGARLNVPRTVGISRKEGGSVLVTGPVEFGFNPLSPLPLGTVALCGEGDAEVCRILGPEPACLNCSTDATLLLPQVERPMEMETSGPVRATVRARWTFFGGMLWQTTRASLTTRLSFFAGTGLVRINMTLHNPSAAAHRGGLWDLGDLGSILFTEFRVGISLSPRKPTQLAWKAEVDQPMRLLGIAVRIVQGSSGGPNWRSRNHVNASGHVPLRLPGYRVRTEDEEIEARRASPVVCLWNADAAVSLAMPEFWQQFPRAIQATALRGDSDPERHGGPWFDLGFFPGRIGDYHELQGGEQKTMTAWLDFAPGPRPVEDRLDWVYLPPRARVEPQWVARTGAVRHLSPAADDVDRHAETLFNEALDGPNNLFARREAIDEYGWRHFGDLYADHEGQTVGVPPSAGFREGRPLEGGTTSRVFVGPPSGGLQDRRPAEAGTPTKAGYMGPRPVISHYNNQYDALYGMLVEYWRTGEGRWWDLADPLARHVIDIDIYHTKRDRAAYNGGLFWHTDHYRSAGRATHRAYSSLNAVQGRRYGGGPSNEQNYTTGLLHYWYLTGDPQAREAVLSLADWVLNMDDGSLTLSGLIDPGPTGWATQTLEPGYHGPGRGAGNSVNALLDGWLLTGEGAYLTKAEELIRRCIHPADDPGARDLLDVERRWSYTVFLSVLARYLDLKAAHGQLDHRYAYARASLVQYAGWMAEHERPYFDRPEQLEYPTEAWAAHELRKANVLRMAARFADEPLRSCLARRGAEFRERAWKDIERFETRTSTRCLAILLTEATRDLYLLAHADEKAPCGLAGVDFGSPEEFIPQRARVKRQLRSARGLLRVLARLLDVRRWPRAMSGRQW